MRWRLLNLLFFALAVCSIAAEPATTTTAPTSAPATTMTAAATTRSTAPTSRPTFDVKATGAAGDGKTLDTAAIQQAIDQAGAAGGGVVSLPAGAYRSGSLFLKSHVTLQVEKDAVLVGSTDDADYPIIDTRIAGIEMKHPAALVNAIACVDVAVVGAGMIDGSGQKWWDLFWKTREERGRGVDFQVPRPRLVCFTRCQNVRVSGLYLQNPAFWCLHILYSSNVDIDALTIRAPAGVAEKNDPEHPAATQNSQRLKAASSDGIDIDSSSDVRISRCDISCDDDDICVKSGRDSDGLRVNKPSENILITDCTIGTGGGISMGSETAGGIRNVTVRRCTFTDTGGAARIKSMPGRGGIVENITFEEITATNVRSPIEINLSWGGNDWKKFVDPKFAADVPEEIGTPHVRAVTIRNFVASGGDTAGTINGLPSSPINDVTFENVWLYAQRGLTINNAPELKLEGIEVEAKEGPNILKRDATSNPVTAPTAPASK